VPRRGTIIRITAYLVVAILFYLVARPDPAEGLIMAAHQGDDSAVEAALAAGISPNTRDPGVFGSGPVLSVAAEGGNTDVVSILLAAGAAVDAPDTSGMTALMYAARAGHPEVAQILLDHGASTHLRSATGHTALQIAERYGPSNGHTRVRRLLRLAQTNRPRPPGSPAAQPRSEE
jgi:ankyrin repeat protein